MNLFAEFIQKPTTASSKKAALWTEADMKENLTAIIKEAKEPDLDRIYITLGGLIPVKLIDNQASFTVKKDSLTKKEVLRQVKGLKDEELFPALVNAHARLLKSLHKSKLAKAAKLAKAKKRKKQNEHFLSSKKQEEILKVDVNVSKLQKEKMGVML